MKLIYTLFCLSILLFYPYKNTDEKFYFTYASAQLKKYNPTRKDYVIVVDYRKSILTERLFLLDIKSNRVILSANVSHAWNSGNLFASDFSNEKNSKKSSKGNYITAGTYFGKFGYSMILLGLDKGVNDNAKDRAIIFHSDKKMLTKWSWGCFATPDETNKKLIDLTRNGVLVCVIV